MLAIETTKEPLSEAEKHTNGLSRVAVYLIFDDSAIPLWHKLSMRHRSISLQ